MSEEIETREPEEGEPNLMVWGALGQIDPRELSPHVPIRWLDFTPQERPYICPEEEYVRSPCPLPIKVLRERWQGLFDEMSLKTMRETPDWKQKRFLYQDMVLQEAFKNSLASDVEFQKRRIDSEIMDICALIEKINSNIDSDMEYAPSKNAGPAGYVKRPLEIESLAKLGNLRLALSDALAKRMGLATEVFKITDGREETLEDRMNRFLMESSPEFRALQHVIENGALPSGVLTNQMGSAVVAEFHSERDMARTIDVTPLPRVEQVEKK